MTRIYLGKNVGISRDGIIVLSASIQFAGLVSIFPVGVDRYFVDFHKKKPGRGTSSYHWCMQCTGCDSFFCGYYVLWGEEVWGNFRE